ncbi:MAG: N-acetyl-gamma-glutamyl-phosphate reductase [Dichotomicrobium sp.]
MTKFRIGVIGASGYTGADLIRLAAAHPEIEIAALSGAAHAGQALEDVFPHLGRVDAPALTRAEETDWRGCDAVFSGLPHGAAQDIIKTLPEGLRVIDMSADFRLRDAAVYEQWYGRSHDAPERLAEAVYGLTEIYGEEIAGARLVACPGCYPTAVLLSLLPLVTDGLIESDDIVIDAKSGVSGAGRSLKQNTLFAEAGEGLSPYGVGTHRHGPEIDQEISRAAGQPVVTSFTPHLVPMSRGELVTCHVRLAGQATAGDLRASLGRRYRDTAFAHLLAEGRVPATQHVRGSNHFIVNVFADRLAGRATVIGALDNLVKGSAGQALQNFNLMFGLPETMGLEQQPLFP